MGEKSPTSYIKSGFKPSEVRLIDDLISAGFGKSRSEIVRLATLSFISQGKNAIRSIEGVETSVS